MNTESFVDDIQVVLDQVLGAPLQVTPSIVAITGSVNVDVSISGSFPPSSQQTVVLIATEQG